MTSLLVSEFCLQNSGSNVSLEGFCWDKLGEVMVESTACGRSPGGDLRTHQCWRRNEKGRSQYRCLKEQV